ncbi:hypothetical protein [Mycolicibacterium sp. PDY-3]|uniref:hypothetical protein n=1 Tax=Mycolicibacterium sp. PDY-3 TaxID=3376069 RepID=UPI0037B05093
MLETTAALARNYYPLARLTNPAEPIYKVALSNSSDSCNNSIQMGDPHDTETEKFTLRTKRWDADLLDRRFLVAEERPPISDAARQLDIKENMRRDRAMSINYSTRGWWSSRNQRANKPKQ